MVCGCVEVKEDSLLTENVCDTFMRTVGRSVYVSEIVRRWAISLSAALVNNTDAKTTSRKSGTENGCACGGGKIYEYGPQSV